MHKHAMTLPVDQLAEALSARIKHKQSLIEERDRRWGKERIKIGSYAENIAFPELFGFDMNDLYRDPKLALEIDLRTKIFWLDNTHDDLNLDLSVLADIGMYFDMTLFGQRVLHTPQGVPLFPPHAVSQSPDLSSILPFDFQTSGVMPKLIHQYSSLKEQALKQYGGDIHIEFPCFHRGPLDICVQMRRYENFASDIFEEPEFIKNFLAQIAKERIRWNCERAAYLGKSKPKTTRVADDWVNIPFISPAAFEEFIAPVYRFIEQEEGPVTSFHTCGIMAPIAQSLLRVFPHIRIVEVSGWDDYEYLDNKLDPNIEFALQFKNTFVLLSSQEEHRKALEPIVQLSHRRKISICAQAIVRAHETFEESILRMNQFIDLAHEMFSYS